LIVADAGALFAYYNSSDPSYRAVVSVVDQARDRFVVSPYALAELDYLLMDRVGQHVELMVLRQFASGAFDLPAFEPDDIGKAVDIIEKYHDQEIGLADASIVVLADRYKTKEILTLDRRHFDVLRPLSGGRFKLLP
jgi:predicted nucleic acid-binding protein